MAEPTLTPARIWKTMTLEQRLRAARAFWRDEDAANDQVQAVLLIAQARKFRPKSVVALDEERKAKHFATLPNLPEALAARALVVYHLADQRPMMAAFLDALGIAHENGLIQDDQATPPPEKLPDAVSAIAAAFPREDVSLYLNTLLAQDPATWAGVEKEIDRLQVQG